MCLVPSSMKRRGTEFPADHCVGFDFLSTISSENMLIKKTVVFLFFLSPAALIRGMLTVNPENRLTLSDVFQHPWCMRYRHILFLELYFFLTKKII